MFVLVACCWCLLVLSGFAKGLTLTSLTGDSYNMSCDDTSAGVDTGVTSGSGSGLWQLNGANIVYTDLLTRNGVIHFIDRVLPADNDTMQAVSNYMKYLQYQQQVSSGAMGATGATGTTGATGATGATGVSHQYGSADADGFPIGGLGLTPLHRRRASSAVGVSRSSRVSPRLRAQRRMFISNPINLPDVHCTEGQGLHCVKQLTGMQGKQQIAAPTAAVQLQPLLMLCAAIKKCLCYCAFGPCACC